MDVAWVKLFVNFYDSKKIKILRKQSKGNDICLLWIMLLALAGKCNDGGRLSITDGVPYDHKTLAVELDFKVSLIEQALMEFFRLNMVRYDGDFIAIENWDEYQNTGKMDEIREYNRKAKQRQRAKLKNVKENVNDISRTCQECQDTEKEKEEDKEKDKELIKKELMRKRAIDPLYGRQ